jgi:choline dehydrogenase-like flavoprotein
MNETRTRGKSRSISIDYIDIDSPFRKHIVIGGGSSGIILTYYLLNAGHDVILIERGTNIIDENKFSKDALRWGNAAYLNGDAKRHLTKPQTNLNNRQVF